MPRPQPPGFIEKVNGIINFAQNPCNAPWYLYAETALPAAGKAILTLLDFGFDDVVRGALRPRGLRSHGHTRGRKRGGGGSRGIPEIGELIGSQIPGAETAKGRQISQGVRHLWIVDGVLQRLLWYWLVVDVTVDFFYNWSTAIMQTEFCSKVGAGSAAADTGFEGTAFATANAWTSPFANNVIYETGGASARNGAHQNAGKAFTGVTSFAGVEGPLKGGRMELRAQIGTHIVQITAPAELDLFGNVEAVLAWDSTRSPLLYSYRTNGGSFIGQFHCFTTGM